MGEQVVDLRRSFGSSYVTKREESYEYENPDLRDGIEWYYLVPAKYGEFYPFDQHRIAFYCTANRVKERILKKYQDQVELTVEGEEESVLVFDEKIFPEIASIAKAKRRRGRKKLSEIEKQRFVEAGRRYQFSGKSLQNTSPGEEFLPEHDRMVVP